MPNDTEPVIERNDILNLIDSFIDQMLRIKNNLQVSSILAFALAPFAIGLVIFLVSHPSFFNVLQNEDEFGIILSLLLSSVIVISSIWIIIGIGQYRWINSWSKRYRNFIVGKQDMEKNIALELRDEGKLQLQDQKNWSDLT